MVGAEMYICTTNYVYTPVITKEITLTTQRAGSPGKIAFKVVNDDIIDFHEGDKVTFHYGGVDMLCGYIFKKQRNTNGIISVTAYDQLRYFKNKDTYTYSSITASELISRLAADCGVKCGEISDTEYLLEDRVESNVSLIDIAQTAIDLTYNATGKLFVLFDNFGEITLKESEEMKSDLLICSGSASDFDYTSSIDEETYNTIKLSCEDSDSGETIYYYASNSNLVNKWGKLQYYSKMDSDEDSQTKAQSLLDIYGCVTRKLKVTDAIGDTNVRAGCLIPVNLLLGDINFSGFLMAEKVVHTFAENTHTMDITLIGGEFVE